MPLLSLPVCSRISLVLNLATQAGVFESLFHGMFGDFERECSMREVFVSGFFVDRLKLFLQSFTFLLKRCQLIFLSFP